MRRFYVLGYLFVLIALNEWAFRLLFPLQPVDQFIRLMVLVLDILVLPVILVSSSRKFHELGAAHWMRSYPRSTAIWLGLFLSYCLVMTGEFSLRYYFKNIYQPPYTEQKTWEPYLHLPSPELGHHLPKDTEVKHTLIVNDTLVYSVLYTTDSRRRRVIAGDDSVRTGHPIIIDGCSFAFGWGIEDPATLHGNLNQLFTANPIYDLATSGYGPQQVFMHTKDPYYTANLGDTLTYYYLFIDEHIRRLNGSRRLMNLWAEDFPYFTLNGDSVVYNGSFRQGRYWKTLLWKCLGKSAIFWATDLDLPWYDSDRMIRLCASTLASSDRNLGGHHPGSEFKVIIAPGSRSADRLIPELQKRGVSYINLSDLLDPNETLYKLHWTEAHPNGLYYQRIAEAIFNYETR